MYCVLMTLLQRTLYFVTFIQSQGSAPVSAVTFCICLWKLLSLTDPRRVTDFRCVQLLLVARSGVTASQFFIVRAEPESPRWFLKLAHNTILRGKNDIKEETFINDLSLISMLDLINFKSLDLCQQCGQLHFHADLIKS